MRLGTAQAQQLRKSQASPPGDHSSHLGFKSLLGRLRLERLSLFASLFLTAWARLLPSPAPWKCMSCPDRSDKEVRSSSFITAAELHESQKLAHYSQLIRLSQKKF
ncbi:hypothetical protein PLICRDRAFT_226392 [Plicaturopsis crispa FD-325 SS-3]|nr:hypothetical protein PLICRDRAFT_226392 [Plicaturopsis crispa FD-325 SS-3]